MDIRNAKELKAAAGQALSRASFDPKKLALIHTGAALALSLVLTVLNYFLTRGIDDTGGLAGMGTRSILSTAQAMLSIGNALVLPFWEVGFIAAAISMARQQPATPDTLLSGFRRFGPVLRLWLLQGVLYVGIAILCLQLGTAIFIMTPLSDPLMELTEPMLTEGFVLDDAMMETLAPYMTPAYVIFAIVFCAVAIPVFYRFRMAQFVIMDTEKVGALKALGTSHKMMRYNRWSLFKLDLSFWWFYGLQLVSTALCYGDVILEGLGVTLPISADAAFFGFYGIHILCQLALAWKTQSYVQTTYAQAYEALRPEAQDPEPPVMKNVPWDYLPE